MKFRLTAEQKKFYDDNGYIVIKNNVSHELLDEMTKRFIDICDENVQDYYVMTIMKDQSLKGTGAKGQFLINKLQDFLHDDIFWKYCSHPDVVDVVEQLIGPQVTAVHSMFINKPPNAEKEFSLHPLHQDLHYFPFRPADKIIASWTASERVDEKNGCLYVVPGSHKKQQLYKHEYPKGTKNAMYHGIQGLDHLPKMYVPMDKGDTVFFHSLLLHGSGPNLTKGFRKSISCHYANSDCYFIDVRGTTQHNIMEEIENLAKKRGAPIKFEDVWKSKSRLVRGPPGNFQKMDSHL